MKLFAKAIPVFLIVVGFTGFVFYEPKEQSYLSFVLGGAFCTGVSLLTSLSMKKEADDD